MPFPFRLACALLLASLLSNLASGKGFQTAQVYHVGTNPTSLTTADFNGDGRPDIVTVASPASAAQNNINVLLSNGDGTFTGPISTVSSSNLSSVGAGDFNRDGKMDIVVADSALGQITVFLGDGTGSFRQALSYQTGTNPSASAPAAIAVGDVNGDGIVDVAVTNSGERSVSVFLGVGDGSFAQQSLYDAGDVTPQALAIADLDGDGRKDLVLTLRFNRMAVLRGNGNGTFQAAIVSIIFNFTNPNCLAVADLNGDGKLDLVIGTNKLLVLFGNGDLTFQTPVPYDMGFDASAATIVDVNHDGRPDIVATTRDAAGVRIFLNQGAGQFQTSESYATELYPQGVVAADFNGDGAPDIAVAANGAGPGLIGGLNVMFNKGDGTYKGSLIYSAQIGNTFGSGPASIVAGDFNGDSRVDLAYVNGGSQQLITLTQQPDYSYRAVAAYAVPFPTQAAVADFNRDGKLDIAVVGLNSFSVFLGNGDGTFRQASSAPIAQTSTHTLALGDLNGDGIPDIVITDVTATRTDIGVALGNGDGTFQQIRPFAAGSSIPLCVGLADFNGDGKLDAAICNAGTGATASTVVIMLGAGDGSFLAPQTWPVGVYPNGLSIGDFNGDGVLDLAVENNGNTYAAGSVTMLFGDKLNGLPTGRFSTQATYITGGSPIAIVSGDFDGNGALDVAVSNGSVVSLLMNGGGGSFQAPVPIFAGAAAWSMAAAEIYQGGAPDLVVSTEAPASTVAIVPNTGGTTVSSSSSLNPSTFRAAVNFQASITAAVHGYGSPTGTISYKDNGATFAQAAISSGQAVAGTSALTVGQHAILPIYSGDAIFNPRALPVVPQTVEKAGTGTVVISSAAPTRAPQQVTLTAFVDPFNGGAPTGTVTFKEGGTTLGVLGVNGGQAQITLQPLPYGTHFITATYSGDNNFLGSATTFLQRTGYAKTGDFDGDGVADFGVYRPSTGHVYVATSLSRSVLDLSDIRSPEDIVVSGDYDGDGSLDYATFRPSNGVWNIHRSSDGTLLPLVFGTPTDIPVPGDYDGDGRTDLAVWRPSTRTFAIRYSRGGDGQVQLGELGDIPLTGDFDGDGVADVAVWRPSNGTWYFIPSSQPQTVRQQQWGLAGDVPVPADYDGDGTTDFAVWRVANGTWYIIRSSDKTVASQQWGVAGDFPVPVDFDGDGRADVAVWRPANGTWYIVRSSDSTVMSQQWGQAGDFPAIPLPLQLRRHPHTSTFDGDRTADLPVWRPSNGTWYVRRSGAAGAFLSQQWGQNGDVLIARDFDGDGATDYGVWRPSAASFYVALSGGGTLSQQLGASTDIPVCDDFDGDGKADFGVWRPSTGTWTVRLSSTQSVIQVVLGQNGDRPFSADFDGDGKADMAVWRASTQTFSVLTSGGANLQDHFGSSSSLPVVGDYDGDGKADFALVDPSSGVWTIHGTAVGIFTRQWGAPGDVIVPDDYDGDGRTDVAVWRPGQTGSGSEGMWYIIDSSTGVVESIQWGAATDIPANAVK